MKRSLINKAFLAAVGFSFISLQAGFFDDDGKISDKKTHDYRAASAADEDFRPIGNIRFYKSSASTWREEQEKVLQYAEHEARHRTLERQLSADTAKREYEKLKQELESFHQSNGTGFLVEQDIVVTARHVIEDEEEGINQKAINDGKATVTFTLPNGEEVIVSKVAYFGADQDIAVMLLSKPMDAPCVTLCERMTIGDLKTYIAREQGGTVGCFPWSCSEEIQCIAKYAGFAADVPFSKIHEFFGEAKNGKTPLRCHLGKEKYEHYLSGGFTLMAPNMASGANFLSSCMVEGTKQPAGQMMPIHGDSGSPLFIKFGAEWKVAAICCNGFILPGMKTENWGFLEQDELGRKVHEVRTLHAVHLEEMERRRLQELAAPAFGTGWARNLKGMFDTPEIPPSRTVAETPLNAEGALDDLAKRGFAVTSAKTPFAIATPYPAKKMSVTGSRKKKEELAAGMKKMFGGPAKKVSGVAQKPSDPTSAPAPIPTGGPGRGKDTLAKGMRQMFGGPSRKVSGVAKKSPAPISAPAPTPTFAPTPTDKPGGKDTLAKGRRQMFGGPAKKKEEVRPKGQTRVSSDPKGTSGFCGFKKGFLQ